jgi:hypothetical protein
VAFAGSGPSASLRQGRCGDPEMSGIACGAAAG